MTTSPPRISEEEDDRDRRSGQSSSIRPAPTGPRGERRADLGVEGDQLVDDGAWSAPSPKRVDGGSSRRGMPGEVERAVEEPGDGDLVGGDERGRRPRPDAARLAGDPQRREARLVGSPELEPAGRQRGRRRPPATGAGRVGQGVLDGKPHVRGAELGLQRAVDEEDGRVDDALRVDHDLDRVVVDIVQPVRLDDLQALVRERRRVDRDLGAHRPGRVAQGLLGGDRGELRGRRVEERPARRRQDRAASTPAIGSPTRHCQIAECSESIGRSQASGLASGFSGLVAATPAASARRERHDEVAAGDERLLVGGRDDLARPQRGEDRARLTMPPVPTTTRSTSSRVASSTSASGPPTTLVPGGTRAGRGGRIADGDRRRSDAGGLLLESVAVDGPAARATTPEPVRRGPRGRRAPGGRSTRPSRGARRRAAGAPARGAGSADDGERHRARGPGRRTGTSRPGRGSRRGPG